MLDNWLDLAADLQDPNRDVPGAALDIVKISQNQENSQDPQRLWINLKIGV
jgi:hypothetical protein